MDFQQIPVGSSSAGLLASGSGRPLLLFNADANNNVWIGNDPSISAADASSTAPLPPLGTLVVDNNETVFGICVPGEQAVIYAFPGGLNFFQLAELIVKTVIISASKGNGLFAFNPSPAAGNLVASIAGSFTIDQFGDDAAGGFAAYTGNGATDLFMALQKAGLIWGLNSNLPAGTGALAIAGPVAMRIQDVLVATDPVNGGPENPHPLPVLQNGWTDRHATDATYPVSTYQLMPDGNVQLCIHLVAGAITSGTVLCTMPAVYTPPHTQIMDCTADGTSAFGPGTPSLLIRGTTAGAAAGQVQLFNAATGTTRIHNAAARYGLQT